MIFSFFYFIPDWCKTQEMYDRIVFEDFFLIVYWSDQYNFQIMCNIAAGYSVVVLKLIPNWFGTSKMIKKVFTALYMDKSVLYFNEDSSNVAFFVIKWVFLKEILNDPDAIVYIRLFSWHNKFEKRKALEKKLNEELMSIV